MSENLDDATLKLSREPSSHDDEREQKRSRGAENKGKKVNEAGKVTKEGDEADEEFQPEAVDGVKHFLCPVQGCAQSYLRLRNLKIHIRGRHGANYLGLLDGPIRTDRAPKPFQCPCCEATYLRKGDLKVHFLKWHNEQQALHPDLMRTKSSKQGKRFPCPIETCACGYMRHADLKSHFSSHHTDHLQRYPELRLDASSRCGYPECNVEFASPQALLQHVETVHAHNADTLTPLVAEAEFAEKPLRAGRQRVSNKLKSSNNQVYSSQNSSLSSSGATERPMPNWTHEQSLRLSSSTEVPAYPPHVLIPQQGYYYGFNGYPERQVNPAYLSTQAHYGPLSMPSYMDYAAYISYMPLPSYIYPSFYPPTLQAPQGGVEIKEEPPHPSLYQSFPAHGAPLTRDALHSNVRDTQPLHGHRPPYYSNPRMNKGDPDVEELPMFYHPTAGGPEDFEQSRNRPGPDNI